MYSRIIVAVDGSPTAQAGLREAIRIAQSSGGRVRLVHVIDELSFAMAMGGNAWGYAGDMLALLRENGQRILDEALAQVRLAGVAVEGALYDSFAGTVQEQLLAEASQWKADLIVMGTHGRRGVGRMMLGSSAEQVVRQADVPVLLIRKPAGDDADAADVPQSGEKQAGATTGAPLHVHQPVAAVKMEKV